MKKVFFMTLIVQQTWSLAPGMADRQKLVAFLKCINGLWIYGKIFINHFYDTSLKHKKTDQSNSPSFQALCESVPLNFFEIKVHRKISLFGLGL